MGVEVATFIADLQPSLPAPTDPKSQGDNHIRLIKQVLQNTFPGANKAQGGQTVISVAASFTILSTQSGVLFAVNTSPGAVTVTLPSLAGTDAGWFCSFAKITGDVNPIFIVNPASAVMLSGDTVVTKSRRCIFGHTFRATWTGGIWVVDRIPKVPVGTILDCPTNALPVGYEWANGQTLVAANYPEYVYAMGGGGTWDRRGRTAAGRTDMGGANNPILGAWIGSTTLGGTGGLESSTIITANLPAYTPSGGVSVTGGSITASSNLNGISSGGQNFVGGGSITATGQSITVTDTRTWGFNGNPQGGTSQVMNNLQPTIITNMIVVVE